MQSHFSVTQYKIKYQVGVCLPQRTISNVFQNKTSLYKPMSFFAYQVKYSSRSWAQLYLTIDRLVRKVWKKYLVNLIPTKIKLLESRDLLNEETAKPYLLPLSCHCH